MFPRFLITLCIFVLLLAPCISAGEHGIGHGPAAPGAGHATSGPAEDAAALDPNEVLRTLLEGNRRFVRGEPRHPNQNYLRRSGTARNGQKPMVSFLSCSDSRVPLEIIFDAGIGDLFVIRIAGNIADKTEIGSLEYGTGHLGTPLLVVLGHTKCGAVTAAVKKAPVSGSVGSLVEKIAPAVSAAKAESPHATEDELVTKAIRANVFQSIEDILRSSAEIRSLLRENKLKIIGALYDLETGKVSDLGVHFKQDRILQSYAR
jgi:carbonic anhydrase